ncbi:type III polyketide synthase [Streptomyces albipurpureus]|uniref:Type III polyketide synthase n=1 Tax=Streptomyces albipurpureus TaxID=2897419 RepID=A0ABT0V0J5_9ACTN|nr:type III polyketide synthase [Streptomyces sp. CWNU-1]MCM2393729.1 type III polyketide synthase [Streptomyces sp. CWNU-1]
MPTGLLPGRETRTTAAITRPAVVAPEHSVTQDEIITALGELFVDVPHVERGLDLMRSTTVETRRLVDGLKEVLSDRSFGVRNTRYTEEAIRLGAEAARQALSTACVTAVEVDYLVFVSCTGYALPGPDAYIAQEIGCRPTMRRTPIQQLGCAAGVSALAEAFHHLQAYPDAIVLVVAVELSSLSFQPGEHTLSDFISNGIFGDGAAAAVLRRAAPEATGFHIWGTRQHLLPASQSVIAGHTSERGLHFRTDPRVRSTVPKVIPEIVSFLAEFGCEPGSLGFCVSHTGGPLIMDGVEEGLSLPPGTLRHSRESMASMGNTSSVSVFDVLRRHHENESPAHASTGLIVAFGPGFTTEIIAGSWNDGSKG